MAGLELAALALVTVVLWRAQPPTVEVQADRSAPQARNPTIIVLPFENLSDDADDMFAAGLTEELIANLMRSGELRLDSAYGRFLEQPSADPLELSERLDAGPPAPQRGYKSRRRAA